MKRGVRPGGKEIIERKRETLASGSGCVDSTPVRALVKIYNLENTIRRSRISARQSSL